jgi:DNA-binding LacI/PurR family transcriptional regulator
VLEKFLGRLQQSGRQSLLFTASADQKVDDILPQILQHQVDALIVTSATLSSDMAAQAARAGMPIILFNRTILGSQASAVCADNVEGGRQIANLLLDSGHQRLAYISGIANTSTNIDREKGFSDRLRERGMLHWQRAEAHYTYQSGYDAALSLLASNDHPDGIFAANDITALGAMDAACALGLRVGEDVSIAGFDDIPMAGWNAYNLTTIRQDVDTMIDRTIELMLEKIADPTSPATLRLVSGQLIVRGSVRGVRPEGTL